MAAMATIAQTLNARLLVEPLSKPHGSFPAPRILVSVLLYSLGQAQRGSQASVPVPAIALLEIDHDQPRLAAGLCLPPT